ncbi:GTPase RsgA [Streptomyces sp. NPDC017890]|uniref:GTPase RsgA n=1 Tax=Streptomyces sp. NPDC017890 TaxID=3365015 RepID=UPI0037ABEA7B
MAVTVSLADPLGHGQIERTPALAWKGGASLGNHLLGEDRPATSVIRHSDGKGRHSTAWRELPALHHGGVLLDTPGLRHADEGPDRRTARERLRRLPHRRAPARRTAACP